MLARANLGGIHSCIVQSCTLLWYVEPSRRSCTVRSASTVPSLKLDRSKEQVSTKLYAVRPGSQTLSELAYTFKSQNRSVLTVAKTKMQDCSCPTSESSWNSVTRELPHIQNCHQERLLLVFSEDKHRSNFRHPRYIVHSLVLMLRVNSRNIFSIFVSRVLPGLGRPPLLTAQISPVLLALYYSLTRAESVFVMQPITIVTSFETPLMIFVWKNKSERRLVAHMGTRESLLRQPSSFRSKWITFDIRTFFTDEMGSTLKSVVLPI